MISRTTLAASILVGGAALLVVSAQAQTQTQLPSGRAADTAPKTSAMLPQDNSKIRSIRGGSEQVQPGAAPASSNPTIAPSSGRQ